MIVGLACVVSAERGAVDRVLSAVAGRLAQGGWRLAGAVQENCDAADDALCDMDIRVLPDGGLYRISQNLGREASGCRLNPDGLETAVADATRRFAARCPDLMIINKFGKMEAEGRGFRGLVGQALADGVPLLLGVNDTNLAALAGFLGEDPPLIGCTETSVLDWAATLRSPVGV